MVSTGIHKLVLVVSSGSQKAEFETSSLFVIAVCSKRYKLLVVHAVTLDSRMSEEEHWLVPADQVDLIQSGE